MLMNVGDGRTIEDSIVRHHSRQAVAGQRGDDVWRISVLQVTEERSHKYRKSGPVFFAHGEHARSQRFVINVAKL